MDIKADSNVSTHEKALSINLDDKRYGTIAEIGAGQEVSAWFFRVGGASGTIAKSMSAYDMKFSDAIYGSGNRYVSKERLKAMLAHEYALLEERLGEYRGDHTTFFAFANTVSAINFQGNNIPHGWVGMRYQITPKTPPLEIILHVYLGDRSNLQQQQAIGILGINLIHACFADHESLDELLNSLLSDLTIDRLEVNAIEFVGGRFEHLDAAERAVALVKSGVARGVVATPDGQCMPALDVIYKSPVVIERGAFQEFDPIYIEMLNQGLLLLEKEMPPGSRSPKGLCEMTIKDVHGREELPAVLIERTRTMLTNGCAVLLTVFPEYYHLTRFLNRYTEQPVRFVIGISSILQLFSEDYYADLHGGLLEAMGRLLAANVKVYVFPMSGQQFFESRAFQALGAKWDVAESLTTVELKDLCPLGRERYLYSYIIEVGALEQVDNKV